MDIEDELVDVLLPIKLQTVVSVGSHPFGVASSVDVVVTGFLESETSTGGHAPLSFGHVLFVVIVGPVGSEEVSWILGGMEEDSEEKGASDDAESVDCFDIVVVPTRSDDGFDHSGSVGGVTSLSPEGH